MFLQNVTTEAWIHAAEEDLIQHEGGPMPLYDDATGKPPKKTWTGKLSIAHGWNVEDNPPGRDLSVLILRYHISQCVRELESRFVWFHTLSGNRKRALVNLRYNMGMSGLLSFKRMLLALEQERWGDAAVELLDSEYAEDVGDVRSAFVAGLIRQG